MALEIHDLQSFISIDPALIGKVVFHTTGEQDPDLAISLVDDAAIREVNREHLGHDYATDVISFDYRDGEEETVLSGEIIVSAETAQRVAQQAGQDQIEELLLYLIHGVLHLSGFDDCDELSALKMWRRQIRLLQELGYPGKQKR